MEPVFAAALLSGIMMFQPQVENLTLGSCSFGPETASIRLEVFSDYQCPACREFYLKTIVPLSTDPRWKGKVCVVYRDVPLKQHRYSRVASRYALAARQLGQVQWQLVAHSLYGNQARWSQDGSVEATVHRALSARDAEKVAQFSRFESLERHIDEETAFALRRQIRSVPTFFLHAHGKAERVVGTVPYEVLLQHLSNIMKSSNN